MRQTILVTGASGLIGSALCQALIKREYQIHTLSHSKKNKHKSETDGIKTFYWDIKKKQIDPLCIQGVDTIIHLAGEPIAERGWSLKRKQELAQSRIESLDMIYSCLENNPHHQVKNLISASAIGYYGDRNDELLNEQSRAGKDFLARLCLDWEAAAYRAKALGLRIVCLRTGIVLAREGGALSPVATTIKLCLGAPLGDGRQWVSWIHIEDVVGCYIHALEDTTMQGTYNMVAPTPISNQEMTETLAEILDRPLWLPHIPKWTVRLAMGERSMLALNSERVSADKLLSTGFKFKFSTLADALENIYRSPS